MADFIYRAVLQSDYSYNVEIRRWGALLATETGFATEDAAKDWIIVDKRRSGPPNPWIASASRNQGRH